MSTIGVYILTTEGLVRIEAIHRRRVPPRSEITVGQDYAQRLRATKYYDIFVSGAGPVGQALGPFEPDCFRLQVEAPFDDGNSWELACFLAHALFAQSRLAGPEEAAEEIVMLTGRVDLGYRIGGVGHIADKIEKAGPTIESWQRKGVNVTLVVPDSDAMEPSEVPGAAEVLCCARVAELMERFGLPWAEPMTPPIAAENGRAAPADRRIAGKRAVALFVVVAALLIVGGVWLMIRKPGDQVSGADTEMARPSTAWLRVYERRPPTGKTCANVYFGTAEAQLAALAAGAGGRLPDSSLARLCGLRFEMGLAEGWRGFVWIERRDGDFLQDGRPRPWESGQDFTDSLEWSIDLPRRMAGPLDYQVVLVAGVEIDHGSLNDLDRFAAQGGTVIALLHRVTE